MWLDTKPQVASVEAGISVLGLIGEGKVDVVVLAEVELTVRRILEEIVVKVVIMTVDVDSGTVFVTRNATDVDCDSVAKKVSVTKETDTVGSGVYPSNCTNDSAVDFGGIRVESAEEDIPRFSGVTGGIK